MINTFIKDIIIVTGGGRGIGLACVKELTSIGYHVFIIGLSEKLIEPIPETTYFSCNLADRNERSRVINLISNLPDIKIKALVNNAAISHNYSAIDYPNEKWDDIISLNLTAVFELSCAFLKLGCKIIINMASVNSFNGARNIVGYTTTKHALLGMTKCLSNEWAHMGIRVNCIAPGFIETDMLNLIDKDLIISRIPKGRIGEPVEVAKVVKFLISDESEYISGTTIAVDGGWLGR